jgi:hypothetical protein
LYKDSTVIRRCIVEWATSYGQWSLHYTERDKRGEIEHTQKIRPILWSTAAKVIGNIYENPELLK